MRRLLNLWPPFLFCGIRVLEISDDWRRARVVLRKRWYNRNYVGTQYGGSLFSMTDPFWMVLTLQCLGRDYIVWDQAAQIEFVAPGRESVYAEFHVDEAAPKPGRPAIAVSGTPDQIVSALQQVMESTGARRLLVETFSREEARLFAREVIPALRQGR